MELAKEEAQPQSKPSLEPVSDPGVRSQSEPMSDPASAPSAPSLVNHPRNNHNDNGNVDDDGTAPSQSDFHDPTPTPPPLPQPRNNSNNEERPVSGIIPPYWGRHYRNASRASQTSSLDRCPVITLEDHTEDPNSDTNRGLWAKSVSVDDYVVVKGRSGSASVGVGAYVVWNCRIQTLEGGPMTIRMRYSEFDDLRQRLLVAFPYSKNALPPLPPKSVLFKFRPSFLESRRVGLEYFLNCVLLNPEFSGSPIVKDFLFGRSC